MKYPDAYPGETELEYINRKEEEARQEQEKYDPASDPVMLFFKFALFIIKIGLVFGVFIYCGCLLSIKLLGEEISKIKIWSFAALFTYLILCTIYFLKGIIIGLRTKGRTLWVLPWLICVTLCCFVPAYMIKLMVFRMFHPTAIPDFWSLDVSWVAFILTLLYIYGIYQFKTNTAPRILFWSYALGLKLSLIKK